MMKDRIDLLIKILKDPTAREDERGDAAIDLGVYNDERALEALIIIASDPSEDVVIVDNCAESIGEICLGISQFNENVFKKLVPVAQKIVFVFIMARNPELIHQPLRNVLAKKFY